jgi:hypothetical protein
VTYRCEDCRSPATEPGGLCWRCAEILRMRMAGALEIARAQHRLAHARLLLALLDGSERVVCVSPDEESARRMLETVRAEAGRRYAPIRPQGDATHARPGRPAQPSTAQDGANGAARGCKSGPVPAGERTGHER